MEHADREETESEDEEDEKNTKRYNLRKIKGKTVYVSASKIFGLDNLRDTDDVIEEMKRGYQVSIGGSFFAGSGGGPKMGKQDGRGNQQYDQDTDDADNEPQQQQDIQDAQPQQRKQTRMLTNLARYNAPRIKDNKNLSGKRNQRDKHQMAAECEKKKSDMQHREKQDRMMENIRAEILAEQQGSTTSSTTTPASSQTTSPASSRSATPITSRETSPSPTKKISRRMRVDENLQDISACMQQTSIDSSGIGLFQEYEAGPEISVADVPQDNTSDDNANGKKQESGKVHLEETRNHTAERLCD
jgi:hypothetical protein